MSSQRKLCVRLLKELIEDEKVYAKNGNCMAALNTDDDNAEE